MGFSASGDAGLLQNIESSLQQQQESSNVLGVGIIVFRR